jgi:hypothetical protein
MLDHSVGPKSHVLGRFRTFSYCTKIDAKLAKVVPLAHKFAKQSRVRIFRNELTRSTPLDPNSCFEAFRTVSLLHECRCKTGRNGNINAQVRQTKLCRNFSQRTHLIHSNGPTTHFWGVSDRFATARKSMEKWPNWCY